jgi:N-methylhydantoinase A
VLEVTTANMQAQLMPLMARRGIDPRDFAMLAYGGAGPTHALLLAREIGVRQVIVPPTPGTLSALGSLVADIKRDSIKTLYAAADELTPAALEDEFTVLELDARSWLEAQRAPVESTMLLRSADMRYKGQSFDMTVPLPGRLGAQATMDDVRAPFHDAYERIYGFADHDAPVEVINLRVTVVGVTPKPQLAPSAAPATASAARAHAERTVYEDRAELRASVFARSELAPGSTFAGPAIVEAADTTVYIPAGFAVQVDEWSNLIAEGGR